MIPRRSKYGAIRTEVDGISFASKKEARRYGELKLQERVGWIDGLTLQPRFPLTVNGELIATYVGDFQYRSRKSGAMIVEDVKGVSTPVFKLKAKLVKVLHGIDVVVL